MLVAGQVVGDLDRGLHAVRLLLHAPRDPDHDRDRQAACQRQVEDRPVDAQVDAADLDRDPRLELELVLGLELLVLAGVAEEHPEQDRHPEVAERRRAGPWCGCSSAGLLRPSRRVEDWVAQVDREQRRRKQSRREPVLALGQSPTSRTASAISQTRPRVAPRHDPERRPAVTALLGARSPAAMPRSGSRAGPATPPRPRRSRAAASRRPGRRAARAPAGPGPRSEARGRPARHRRRR